jgi:hypothetical protein
MQARAEQGTGADRLQLRLRLRVRQRLTRSVRLHRAIELLLRLSRKDGEGLSVLPVS